MDQATRDLVIGTLDEGIRQLASRVQLSTEDTKNLPLVKMTEGADTNDNTKKFAQLKILEKMWNKFEEFPEHYSDSDIAFGVGIVSGITRAYTALGGDTDIVEERMKVLIDELAQAADLATT